MPTLPEWLPALTLPDLGVLATTIFLCLAAARIFDVADFIGGLFRGPKKP
jgi:hypothetical protein